MQLLEQLFEAKRTERVGRVVRRVSMLIVFIQIGTGFSAAGRNYGCDRRTVSMWWMRFCEARKTPAGIKSALSDRPRTGRPPKIKREILEEARRWCEGRAFTLAELRDHLEKMSGVRLSLVQTWPCRSSRYVVRIFSKLRSMILVILYTFLSCNDLDRYLSDSWQFVAMLSDTRIIVKGIRAQSGRRPTGFYQLQAANPSKYYNNWPSGPDAW